MLLQYVILQYASLWLWPLWLSIDTSICYIMAVDTVAFAVIQ